MKLLFFTEARLTQTAEGKFYSADQSFSYQMFKRYLNPFNSVLVVARAAMAAGSDTVTESTRVDDIGVTVLPLPYYVGPFQYLAQRRTLLKTLHHYIDSHLDAAFLCRVPGAIGTAAGRYLGKRKKAYGVEVVGDPLDVFAPGSFSHPLRALFRYKGGRDLKTVVQQASAALYVSKETLQARYPTAKNVFSTHASNVMLPPEAFVPEAKTLTNTPPFSIVTVGTLAAMYKSPDIAIAAMAILKQRGLRVSLQWLGDGRYRPEMVALAAKVGVSDVVSFIGNIGTADEVRAYLDGADLFVLPSRQEGLPRAMVEAMARGLPCIGTNIGGIPELLEDEALVPVNDPERLADTIEHFLTTPGLANAQAKRNLLEARNYAFDILETRRNQFYEYLKGIS
jgi:glycosyltransferase involved in cell wall biosynthesis